MTVASLKWARAKASLAEPGLAMTRSPGWSIASTEINFQLESLLGENALWRLVKEPPQLAPIQPHDLLHLGGRRRDRPFSSADENKADAGLSAELLVTTEGHEGADIIAILRMHG